MATRYFFDLAGFVGSPSVELNTNPDRISDDNVKNSTHQLSCRMSFPLLHRIPSHFHVPRLCVRFERERILLYVNSDKYRSKKRTNNQHRPPHNHHYLHYFTLMEMWTHTLYRNLSRLSTPHLRLCQMHCFEVMTYFWDWRFFGNAGASRTCTWGIPCDEEQLQNLCAPSSYRMRLKVLVFQV